MSIVNYNVEDRVAYITLNRPEKRNALNANMVTALKEAFEEGKNDELAKALLLAKAAMGRDPVVTSFSQQEWDSFRIKELRHDSFVKSGNSYFRPTKTTNNWITICII